MILRLSVREAVEFLFAVPQEDLNIAFALYLELQEAAGQASYERGLVAV